MVVDIAINCCVRLLHLVPILFLNTYNKYLKVINWKLLNIKYQENFCKREIIYLKNKMS